MKEQRSIDGVPVPTIEGYAPAQQIHAEENWAFMLSNSDNFPTTLQERVRRENTQELLLNNFLQWIKKTYSPRFVY